MGDMGEIAGRNQVGTRWEPGRNQVGTGAGFSMVRQAGTPAKRPPFSELGPEHYVSSDVNYTFWTSTQSF